MLINFMASGARAVAAAFLKAQPSLFWRLTPGQYFLIAFLLIVAGAIAAEKFISEKNEQAGSMIKKMVKAQTVIGAIVLVLGLIFFIAQLSSFGIIIGALPLTGILLLLGILLMIVLGVFLLLSFLKTRKEVPQEKLEQIEKKLNQFQIPLGLTAIGIGVYFILGILVKWGF